MDVKFINPVLHAILHVLATMAKLEPKAGKPTLKTDQEALGDITGVMSMVGKQVRGSIAITFTEPVILDIAKRMLGEDKSKIDGMVIDLTGEITNMVTGVAKEKLEVHGYNFEMSLPTVIIGKNHLIAHRSKGPMVIIPFSTDSGKFYVEISFENL